MAKITLNPDYEAEEKPEQSGFTFCEMLMRLWDSTQFAGVWQEIITNNEANTAQE